MTPATDYTSPGTDRAAWLYETATGFSVILGRNERGLLGRPRFVVSHGSPGRTYRTRRAADRRIAAHLAGA